MRIIAVSRGGFYLSFVAFALACALYVQPAHGCECSIMGFEVWPPPGPIPCNAVFVVEGYGDLRSAVLQLSAGDLFLETATDRVSLVRSQVFEGQWGMTQVVFRAEHRLEPHTFYTLGITREDGLEWFVRYPDGDSRPRYEWRTEAGIDEDNPEWLRTPAAVDSQYGESPCGTAARVEVDVKTQDANPVLVLVSMAYRFDASASPASYFVERHGERLFIEGHGMCSGGFVLQPGAEYRATLVAMDAGGNMSEEASVVFWGPEANPSQR